MSPAQTLIALLGLLCLYLGLKWWQISRNMRVTLVRQAMFIKHSPAAIAMFDRNMRYVAVSDRWRASYQIAEENIIGKSHYAIFPDIPDRWKHIHDYCLKGHSTSCSEDCFLHNEKLVWVKWGIHPWYEADGRVGGVIMFTEVITAFKDAEEKLRDTIHKLMEANGKLERYAHICSHDLQEPLRVISIYSQLLSRHLETELDDKGKKYLEYLTNSSTRASQLVTDMLQYARLSHETSITMERVDMNTIVHEVKSNLENVIKETSARIHAESLPMVTARSTQMVQLLQNLVGNAIKFSSPGKPDVEIGAERKGNQWQFFVRDHGIGIAPDYFEKIFVIFQRLHTAEEYPGTGVGLAICKKIVEQHEGDIWLESEPGKGATFYFSLPALLAGVEQAA